MTQFMIEHPWMTFIVAGILASGFADGFRRLCRRRKPKSQLQQWCEYKEKTERKRAREIAKAAAKQKIS